MNKHLFLISVAVATLLTSCKDTDNKKTSDKSQYVITAEAKGTSGEHILSYPGKTHAEQRANVAFRVSGPIRKMNVNVGDHVRKGQVIAELDDRDYRTQLAATQAEYDNIKADAERVVAMYNEENATASNYDKARYGLEQITQKLNNHRNQLADTKLLSPIDGYIDDKLHETGETIGAGMPVYSISSSGDVEIEIFLPAADYANIENFKSFYCTFDVDKERTYPLHIERVRHDANANQLYSVILQLTDKATKGDKITPGMSTLVYATVGNNSETLSVRIPSTAVINKDGETIVYVLNTQSQTVSRRTVAVESFNNDGTCTVSNGLLSGETVVSAGVRYLNDGDKVKTMPEQPATNVGKIL